MPHRLYEKLKNKGWKEEEIETALKILGEAKTAPRIKKTTPFLYWAGLFLAIIGNTIIAVTLIPLLIILQGPVLYFMVAMLSIIFGTLISVLLHDIEDVDPHHKIMGWLFVPALAIINIYIIVRIASEFRQALFITAADTSIGGGASAAALNPILISIIYAAGFIIPYAIKQLVEKKH